MYRFWVILEKIVYILSAAALIIFIVAFWLFIFDEVGLAEVFVKIGLVPATLSLVFSIIGFLNSKL